MSNVIVLKAGVEGGGLTVYGRQEDGVWSFWQGGTSWGLDENDEEECRSWSTPPTADLLAALPREWHRFHPIEIHPDFAARLRAEYERCREVEGTGTQYGRHSDEAWRRAFARHG